MVHRSLRARGRVSSGICRRNFSVALRRQAALTESDQRPLHGSERVRRAPSRRRGAGFRRRDTGCQPRPVCGRPPSDDGMVPVQRLRRSHADFHAQPRRSMGGAVASSARGSGDRAGRLYLAADGNPRARPTDGASGQDLPPAGPSRGPVVRRGQQPCPRQSVSAAPGLHPGLHPVDESSKLVSLADRGGDQLDGGYDHCGQGGSSGVRTGRRGVHVPARQVDVRSGHRAGGGLPDSRHALGDKLEPNRDAGDHAAPVRRPHRLSDLTRPAQPPLRRLRLRGRGAGARDVDSIRRFGSSLW